MKSRKKTKNISIAIIIAAACVIAGLLCVKSWANIIYYVEMLDPYVTSRYVGEDYTGLYTYDNTPLGRILKQDERVWYVVDGEIMMDYTGFVEKGNGGYQYIESGEALSDVTGFFPGCIDGLEAQWYVVDGAADKAFTGFVAYNGGIYYVYNGFLAERMTDLIKDDNGEIDETRSTWYVISGKVADSFSGIVYLDGYKSITDGRLDGDANGFIVGNASEENSGWCIANETGLIEGRIGDTDGFWYIKDGRLMTDFSGNITFDGVSYTVKNGLAALDQQETYTSGVSAKTADADTKNSAEAAVPTVSNVDTSGSITKIDNLRTYSEGQYMGVVSIPSLYISVNLYVTHDVEKGQDIVDRKNSAALDCRVPIPEICDHVNQAFGNLKNAKPGAILYINSGNKSYRYKCVHTATAASESEMDAIEASWGGKDGSVVLYTCNPAWPNVFMALFEPQ